jgi:hypothetical protein
MVPSQGLYLSDFTQSGMRNSLGHLEMATDKNTSAFSESNGISSKHESGKI